MSSPVENSKTDTKEWPLNGVCDAPQLSPKQIRTCEIGPKYMYEQIHTRTVGPNYMHRTVHVFGIIRIVLSECTHSRDTMGPK